MGLGLRQAVKNETTCNYPYRDEQFNYIAELRDRYHFWGRPVLSIDTKLKEKLGDFYRSGSAWTDGQVTAPDHDFPSRATGKLVPYGVYDVGFNEGLMMLTTSADTAELACDAVRRWWHRLGKWRYETRSGLFLLCDCGGSNSNRQYLFKESIKNLAIRLGLTIRVAHYPPGCSKYNPIERRMFCHVARSLQGVILDSIDTAAISSARPHGHRTLGHRREGSQGLSKSQEGNGAVSRSHADPLRRPPSRPELLVTPFDY